jgi:hypothetical protein
LSLASSLVSARKFPLHRRREKMNSKQQFRSGKPAPQSLHQIAADIAAMRVPPPCGRYLSRRINGRTDIT